MEHVWQSPQEHAAGALDVAEDPPDLLPGTYLGAVLVLPGSDEVEKCFPVRQSCDFGDLEEDIPQLTGMQRLWGDPAPAQALPLDMNQATLDDRIRPERPENLDYLSVAVHGEAAGMQALVHHRLEERTQLRSGVLADVELSPHQRVSLPVHQDDDAVRAVQECPVEEKISGGLRLQGRRWRRIGKEAVDQAAQLPPAVPALKGQLAYRIPLHYPSSEPLHLSHASRRGVAPTERMSASAAETPLSTIRIAAIPQGHIPTLRTVFFGVMTP